MTWSDIDWRPASRTLRQFAALWLLFFGLLAWRTSVHDHPRAVLCLGSLAGLVGVAGLLWPASVRLLFVVLTALTLPVGWAVSRLILALVFYGMLTPLGALFRLGGRDVLQLRPGPGRSTYWEPKVMPADSRRYLQPF
jgi:hypothetical protein